MLINRGSGMIYDHVLKITWLHDANYTRTSGFDADGAMSWDNANAWAAGLSYGGYADWRLPTVSLAHCGTFAYGDLISTPSNSCAQCRPCDTLSSRRARMVFGLFKKKPDRSKVALDVIPSVLQVQLTLGGGSAETVFADNWALG